MTSCISSRLLADEPASPFSWPAVTRTAKPWTRWWWLGNAVDKENLTRSLDAYQKAGIGGVEVTCIYGVQGQDAREIKYLSPQWVEVLRHTCAEAKRLDMGVDLPPGSGWCIGGPQIPPELANANVVIATKPAEGGQPLLLSFGDKRPQAVVAFPESGGPVHLDDKIDAKGELTWTPPAGKWVVYTVSQKFSGQMVKRPAPGGEGRAFNPFSSKALDVGLGPFDNAISQLPAGAIRSQFHDSFEYQGDWTQELFGEFQRRCGYDLRDHLPALIGGPPRDQALRVQADYRRVMGELLLDNVIGKWVEKAHARGQLARNQAHGSPGNLLDLYAAADIPETEVFRDDQDPLVAKFASSAAHVAGRRLCSSETFTWMSEHFTETLGQMRREADFLFATGINHIFYHGTAYSPADAAWPGWCFYASTEMNPRNSIWHDAGALNAYFARVQSVLQEGQPDNDILLYWPASDVWQSEVGDARHLMVRLAVHGKFWINDLPCGKLATKLWQRGYGFDFVSDRQLMASKVVDGKIVTAGGKYAVLVVPRCQFMPPETIEQIARFLAGGGQVVFDQAFPSDAPGLDPSGEGQARLKAALKGMTGNLMLGEDIEASLRQSTRGVAREPMVDVPGLMFIRRATPDAVQYFVSHHGEKAIDGWVSLGKPGESIVLMDPMTGDTGRAAMRKDADGRAQVYLQLQPGASVILRALPTAKLDGPAWNYQKSTGDAIALSGTWHVKFIEGGPELPPDATVDKLATWTSFSEPAQRFGGTAVYSITFDAPAGGEKFALDLGKVAQSARIRLNGRELGTLLLAPFRVPAVSLNPKGNVLEVEVSNVSANRIRDLDRRGVKWRIFKDINLVNVNYKPFDASNWPLTDSGLLGPVTLQPVANLAPAP